MEQVGSDTNPAMKFLAGSLVSLFSFCFYAGAQLTVFDGVVGTGFRYQGVLKESNGVGAIQPANGQYAFRFKVFKDPLSTNGFDQVGSSFTNPSVVVSNGLFAVDLDFGPIFGTSLYLDIAVATNAPIPHFTQLLPRNPISSVATAVWARNGGLETLSLRDGACLRVRITCTSVTYFGTNTYPFEHRLEPAVVEAVSYRISNHIPPTTCSSPLRVWLEVWETTTDGDLDDLPVVYRLKHLRSISERVLLSGLDTHIVKFFPLANVPSARILLPGEVLVLAGDDIGQQTDGPISQAGFIVDAQATVRLVR